MTTPFPFDLLIALAGGILTTLVVFLLGSKLSDYKLERTVAIYGVVTGTVSTGLMLLRIVDPELRTPVAREIGFMNVFALPVGEGSPYCSMPPFGGIGACGSPV